MSKQTKKQNSYTSEFKEPAVKLAIEPDHPIAKTFKDLGINVNMLHTWIGKYSKPKTPVMTRTDEHIYDENNPLKKELARSHSREGFAKKGHSVLCERNAVDCKDVNVQESDRYSVGNITYLHTRED